MFWKLELKCAFFPFSCNSFCCTVLTTLNSPCNDLALSYFHQVFAIHFFHFDNIGSFSIFFSRPLLSCGTRTLLYNRLRLSLNDRLFYFFILQFMFGFQDKFLSLFQLELSLVQTIISSQNAKFHSSGDIQRQALS